jgi:VWFA-related protein
MTMKLNGFGPAAALMTLVVGLAAQEPQPPTFRVQIDAVNMDVIVKDSNGRFIPDLKKEDFEIYEDGVKQDITSMTMSYGGRVTNVLSAPPPPTPEGILLPPRRVVNDTSGRIFLFFVDDLHLQFQQSGRVRQLFEKISKLLIHEGDLFGIVSSGPSSISVDMTYDRKRLDDAIKKIHGDGLKPSEIIQRAGGSEGPTELRHRAHVAFTTMLEGLNNLEKVTNRRKALVWVSEGYDFNPFQDSRYGLLKPGSPFMQNQSNQMRNQPDPGNPDADQNADPQLDGLTSQMKQSETFSDADLAYELSEITRAANRANTTIYTIDPRGLVAGQDIDEPVDPQEWGEHLRKTQDTMRVLADDTGGYAVVNQNDFDKALKRIDADSSDYYVLGYYSSNPDPSHRRRKIEVKTPRSGLDVFTRTEYLVLKPPPPPIPSSRQ